MYGVERFKEIFDKYSDRPILLYGDPDVDGLMSLLLMCQFCDCLGKKYSFYVNENRYHGFELSPKRLSGYMVIASDFQISESEVQAIVDNDVVLLSTDHHDCQKTFIDVKGDTAEGIVINNQYPFEPEEDRYLSGAGVFYELACSLIPAFKTKERDAIVGITLLSDVREIENSKARNYLKAAYSIDTSQGYINYLITSTLESDFGFGVPRLDRNFIDYTLNPCINAMLRYNLTNDAVAFVLGGGLKSTEARGNQKELVEEIIDKADKCIMNNVAILAVKASDFYKYDVKITNFIGYACSAFKDKHKGISTIGLVYENGKVLRTSFRGRYDDIHYITSFRNLGLDAHGHANSFGIQNFMPTEDTWVSINDLIGELEEEHKSTITIIETNNLGMTVTMKGSSMASENCYVRDMYRTYIKYTGNNIKVVKKTFKKEEFTSKDYQLGLTPDETKRGVDYKYLRDENGEPIVKYIEYLVDGRKVKSFGEPIEGNLILPIHEKSYINLYVRSILN